MRTSGIFRIKLALVFGALPLGVAMAGALAHGDPLWLITHFPYGELSYYGKGTWLHYPLIWHNLFGLFSIVLAVFALRRKGIFQKLEPVLALASILLYSGSHMALWAAGGNSSMGLGRYMIAIAPAYVFLIFAGLNGLLQESYTRWARIISLLLVIFLIENTVRCAVEARPDKLRRAQAAFFARYEQTIRSYDEVVFFDPRFSTALKANPFDAQSRYRLFQWTDTALPVEKSRLIIWDQQLGPNEGRLPFEWLESNTTIIAQETYPFPTLNADRYRLVLAEMKQKPGGNTD